MRSRSRQTPRPSRIASGRSPVGPIVSGRIRLRGRRRKALALRRPSQDAGPRDLARLGLPVDPDLLVRSLTFSIEPERTRGHRFSADDPSDFVSFRRPRS